MVMLATTGTAQRFRVLVRLGVEQADDDRRQDRHQQVKQDERRIEQVTPPRHGVAEEWVGGFSFCIVAAGPDEV